MNEKPEHILCSAIWVDTGEDWPPRRTYAYPKTGLLFCGLRHPDCLVTWQAWNQHQVVRVENSPKHQGFLTSTGRFVDREAAAIIAHAAGQISEPLKRLHSEDMW